MLVTVTLIEWPEAISRSNSGTLHQELFSDERLDWASPPTSWWSDSSVQFMNMEEAYDVISPFLSDENRKNADASIGVLFRSNAIYELDQEMECWFMALSPSTVQNISKSLDQVDFSPFRELYEEHCPESIKSGLSDDDYQEDFYSYVLQWRDALKDALERGWGLMGHVG